MGKVAQHLLKLSSQRKGLYRAADGDGETHRAHNQAQPGATALQGESLHGAMMGNTLTSPLRGQARCAQPCRDVRRGKGCSSGPFSLSPPARLAWVRAGGEAGLPPCCPASTHIPVGHVPVRALAVGQHLPHNDAVAPHVAGRGELAVCDGLRSRPANGDLPPLKK